jgi:hypothetical protein
MVLAGAGGHCKELIGILLNQGSKNFITMYPTSHIQIEFLQV